MSPQAGYVFVYRPQVEDELRAGAPLQTKLLAAATAVEQAVPAQMPGHDRSRPFVDRLFVSPAENFSFRVGTRWALGHIIEWGSRNNPPYAPLRKAVRAVGLSFQEIGK